MSNYMPFLRSTLYVTNMLIKEEDRKIYAIKTLIKKKLEWPNKYQTKLTSEQEILLRIKRGIIS